VIFDCSEDAKGYAGEDTEVIRFSSWRDSGLQPGPAHASLSVSRENERFSLFCDFYTILHFYELYNTQYFQFLNSGFSKI
jgi:hypothetical protein